MVQLIIFARYWEPGRVKTRLCPPLTPDEAASAHRALLDVCIQRLQVVKECNLILAFAPDACRDAFAQRYPGVILVPQQGDGLTARLWHLLETLDAPCLFTGSDCPTIPLDYVYQGLCALQSHDVVLGPTEDGGSYLLGLHPAQRAWLTDIPWSTERVSACLRQRAQVKGWTLQELPRWYDVDSYADLRRCACDLRYTLDGLLASCAEV
ncbi:MAG: TIGR04282 family arsenosugar biosynthesis glycosyltransferase [Armatimonadota bacterium]